MSNKRFNPAKLEKLNNPKRLIMLPPTYILEKAGISSPSTIIDLGAGTGLYGEAIANIYPAAKVIAADISELMINWIRQNKLKDTPNLQPLLMQNACIDLPNECSDFLFMIFLHHELDEPENTLKECRRLLAKGGKIAIADWKKQEMDMGPNVDIRVSPFEIEAQLKKSGFNNIKVFEDLEVSYLVVAEK